MKGARKNSVRKERTTVRMIRMLGERLSAVGEEAESVEPKTRDRLREFMDGVLPREQKTRERDARSAAPSSSFMKQNKDMTKRAATVAHDFRTAR